MEKSLLHSRKTSDDYVLNQCSLMIRVNGEELEVPLNFGMSADDIKRLYPFILQFASMPIKNPAAEFGHAEESGDYSDFSDEEVKKIFDRVNEQARYWYGKSEASLLEIAVRFALDIKLRGVKELMDLFLPVSPLDMINSDDIKPLTDEEATQVIEEMGLETDTDHERDTGDENDIGLTTLGGDLLVNLYDSDVDDEFFSKHLDELQANARKRMEQFKYDINVTEDQYKSNYHAKGYTPDEMAEIERRYKDDTNTSSFGVDDIDDMFDVNRNVDAEPLQSAAKDPLDDLFAYEDDDTKFS